MKKREDIEFDLEFHIYSLLFDEPFFAKLSRYMKKVPVYYIQTVGVRFNSNTYMFELLYNPKFFKMLIDSQEDTPSGREIAYRHIRAVLLHEFYHCCLGHVTFRNIEGIPMKKLNIATDLAINSLEHMRELFSEIPFPICMPGKEPFKDLPHEMSMEWYLKNLPEGPSDENKPHGDHSGWSEGGQGQGEGGGELSEDAEHAAQKIAQQKMNEHIKKAIEECNKEQVAGNSKAWGSVTSKMKQEILERLQTKLDPKAVLRYFIKNSVRANKRNSITRINKRWRYIHPGKRYDRTANIAISIDESGSVSNEMIAKFLSWVEEFSKFATFTFVPFDHEVFEEKVFVWKKGKKYARERELCGGTSFDAPTEWVNERKFDGHIVLTDLCAPAPGRSKCQRIWVTDQDCMQYSYFVDSLGERILAVD